MDLSRYTNRDRSSHFWLTNVTHAGYSTAWIFVWLYSKEQKSSFFSKAKETILVMLWITSNTKCAEIAFATGSNCNHCVTPSICLMLSFVFSLIVTLKCWVWERTQTVTTDFYWKGLFFRTVTEKMPIVKYPYTYCQLQYHSFKIDTGSCILAIFLIKKMMWYRTGTKTCGQDILQWRWTLNSIVQNVIRALTQ